MNQLWIRIVVRTVVSFCALLGATSLVLADCVDGVRSSSAAEIEFAARAEAALAAALPAPIANSERRGAPYDFSKQPHLSFCRGDKEGAFSVGVAGGYLYKFPKAEYDRLYVERKAVEKQIEELEKLPPEKEAEYKQLLAQARAIYDAAPRRQRKDPPFTPEQQAQVDRANVEARKVEQAASTVVSDHRASVKSQTDSLREQARRLEGFPQELSVQLGMNLDRLPESGPTVATFGSASAARSTGLRVHNVVLVVEGREGPARQALFDAVDKSYLQELIGQPLPDVAASKLRAERAASAAPVSAPR